MHLDRIKSAVDQLRDPALESFQSTLSTEDAVSQKMMATSVSSSQELGNFVKPAPRKAGGAVAAELRAVLDREREESKQRLAQEKEESEKRHTELMEQRKEWEQQRMESEQQREDAKQREERLVARLKQQRKELQYHLPDLSEWDFVIPVNKHTASCM